LAGPRQIAKHVAALAIEDERAGGHVNNKILAALAAAASAAAGPATLGAPVLGMDDAGQTVGAVEGLDNDAAPRAAVAAVRPAARHVLLAPEAAAAAAAVAPLHKNRHTINKHACTKLCTNPARKRGTRNPLANASSWCSRIRMPILS